MNKNRLLLALILLSFALILAATTGCEKNAQILKLNIKIDGNGFVHQTYATKVSSGYTKGSLVMLTAKPDKGWAFSHWEGDLTGSENPKEITVTEPTEITAVFVPTLSVAWCGNWGSVTPSGAFIAKYDVDLFIGPAEVPENYDVLVIDELYNLDFSVTDFTGKVIVTFDSGVEAFLDQMLYPEDGDDYWDYETKTELIWSSPISGEEVGAYGDAQIYHTLDNVDGFTRRADIIQASSTADADDIILYEISTEKGFWDWLHIGPHFGDYGDYTFTRNRLCEIIDYVLKVLDGKNPEFPPLPEL